MPNAWDIAVTFCNEHFKSTSALHERTSHAQPLQKKHLVVWAAQAGGWSEGARVPSLWHAGKPDDSLAERHGPTTEISVSPYSVHLDIIATLFFACHIESSAACREP